MNLSKKEINQLLDCIETINANSKIIPKEFEKSIGYIGISKLTEKLRKELRKK